MVCSYFLPGTASNGDTRILVDYKREIARGVLLHWTRNVTNKQNKEIQMIEGAA